MTSEPHELSTAEGYARWARSYDDGSNPLLPPEQAIVEPLLARLGYATVLDVGAGTGRYSLLPAHSEARVTAVDPSTEMLAELEGKPGARGVEVLRGDLEGAPWHPRRFDLVICALVLCHLHELGAALDSLADAVVPGGHLLVTDFHPLAVEAGLRTEFRDGAERYMLPNPVHRPHNYRAPLTSRGFTIIEDVDIPMGDCYSQLPADAFSVPGPGRVEAMHEGTWRTLPFGFVLLARAPVA